MIRNCENCGKVHNFPAKLCQECLQEKMKLYKKVKNYLWEHPNSTVDEVHAGTGVKKEKILQFVREDRFIVTDGILQDQKLKELGFKKGTVEK